LPPGYPERFRPLVTIGKAAEEIVRVARGERVDLILLGISGQRRWRHMLWPSVPAQIMRRTLIPVMMLCTVGRCLLPPQRMQVRSWLGGLDRQSCPLVDELDPRSCWQPNDIETGLMPRH
jgi:hypothetical protein